MWKKLEIFGAKISLFFNINMHVSIEKALQWHRKTLMGNIFEV